MEYKDLYEKWQNDKYFVIDGDKLKENRYVFSSFPTSNIYGFQTGKIRSVVFGDVVARYHRLQNRNVLFPIGFNTLSQSSFIESRKSSNSLNDDIANIFYEQMLKMGISINENKKLNLRSNSYISNLQLNFIKLYENGYIKYMNDVVGLDIKTNKIYDAKIASYDEKKSMRVFELDVTDILDNLISDINELNIDDSLKEELISYFKPISVLKFDLSCSNGNMLHIEMENPEYLGGVAYIFLNPEHIDIKPYTSLDEYEVISEYIKNPTNLFAYSGITAINPLTGNEIPIFISNLYSTGVYLGIPSISDEDLSLAETEGFEYKEILEEGLLKNSDFLDGMSLSQAHNAIFEAFTQAEVAQIGSGYLHTRLLIHQLDKFGALFPYLEYKGDIKSLEGYLPFNFSSQFRPILDDNVKIPGNPIDGTMSSGISLGMAPLLSLAFDEIGLVDSLFSKSSYNDFMSYFPIDSLVVDKDNIINELLMPLILYNFIKKHFDNLPKFVKSLTIVEKSVDVKLNDIKRSNNNLIDFDTLLEKYNPDAIRMFSLSTPMNDVFVFNEYIIEDYDSFISKIKNRILKIEYSNNNDLKFNLFAENCKNYIEDNNIVEYRKLVEVFSNNEILNGEFSKHDLLIYLRAIHPLLPFLTEELYEEIFNGRYSIVNEGFPY